MAIKPTADYTDKDFDAILAETQALMQVALPAWTDFSSDNFGNVIIQAFAFMFDRMTFYMDQYANEAFLGTVLTRRSLISLGKLIAFKPNTSKAAITTQTLSIPSTTAGDVEFDEGDQVRTKDGIAFELQADAVILAGQTSTTILVENSVARSSNFVGTGAIDQQYILDRTPYIDGSAAPTVDGGSFAEVDSFLLSGPTDKHFVVSIDENDQATVIFGDGTNGEVPPASSAIVIPYKTGGGLEGNVGVGTIVEIDGPFQDTLSNPVLVSTTNAAAAVGGVDRESLEAARERAPLTLRQVGDRTVADDDYVANSEEILGVERAQAISQEDDPALLANEIRVEIVPTDLGVPSTALKDSVKTNLTVTKPNTIGLRIVMEDPVYKVINIEADISLDAGADSVTVQNAVTAALTAYFAPRLETGVKNPLIDFGKNKTEIPFSDLFCAVANVEGVRKVDEDSFLPADDSPLALRDWPKLGTVLITII